MLFDTDMNNSQELTCQIEIVFAWLTFSSIPILIGTECYCFPTFKDLSRFFARPFCQWECKGNRGIFLTKFFEVELSTFSKNRLWKSISCWRTSTRFFRADGKDKDLIPNPPKKFHFLSAFRRTTAISQQRAAKIGRNGLPTKKNWKKHSKSRG